MSNKSVNAVVFFKSIVGFSISSWINFVFGLLAVVILTRLLQPDVYGEWNLFTTAISVVVAMGQLGFDGAFFRFFNEPPAGWSNKQLFTLFLTLSVLFVLSMMIVTCIIYTYEVKFFLGKNITFFFLLTLFVSSICFMVLGYFCNAYRMLNDIRKFNITNVMMQSFSKLSVVVAAVINPTIEMVLGLETLVLILLLILCLKINGKYWFSDAFNTTMKGMKSVFKFALFSWPVSILDQVNMLVVPMGITMILSSYYLGIYASAGFVVSAFAVIRSGFQTFWTSFMYAHYKDSQGKIIEIHDYIILFCIMIMCAFIIFQHGIYLFIGADYQESRAIFSLILMPSILLLISQTTTYGISIAKKNYLNLIIFVIVMLINVIILYLLLKNIGLIGAALATDISAIVQLIMATYWGQKYYKTIASFKRSIIGVTIILFISISNYFLVNFYFFELLFLSFMLMVTIALYYSQMKKIYVFLRGTI